ncbi:hypothetical protein SmJEL517_g05883 [Synchytrium microbalum]|uniref:Methyltransferase domain-containing protein n=1 Tax=Synchytrium microbalum TaxID=1806994 RepID=A0A507BU59_9FUNG|nr:uncharacterized protein SmJEL517_g05883 [Synchytrium microbalum]TPX30579.1 hypothetical protein SmJEL517_g05883 [Synchytrium microbalum]
MDVLPDKNSGYGTKEYWDSRYEQEIGSTFDWFKTFEALRPHLEELIPKFARIIHLGTGNSTLPEDMFDTGYHNQVAMDYSPVVIQSMKQRNLSRPGLEFIEADVFRLDSSFEAGSFDIAIDKGTLDAFLTSERDHDPWNPSDETKQLARDYMQQVQAILKPTGKFIHITFAQPHFRKPLLNLEPTMQVKTARTLQGDGFDYFLYISEHTLL